MENGVIRLILLEKRTSGYVFYAENSVSYSGFDNDYFRSSEEVFEQIRSLYAATENKYGICEDLSYVLLPGFFYVYDLAESQVRIESGTVTEKDVNRLKGKKRTSSRGMHANILQIFLQSDHV